MPHRGTRYETGSLRQRHDNWGGSSGKPREREGRRPATRDQPDHRAEVAFTPDLHGRWSGTEGTALHRAVSLPEWGRDRLLSTGQADRQRLNRVVQRPPTSGMPERLVVPVAGRCPRAHRGLEVPRQRRSTPYGPGRLDAPSLRQQSCHRPRTCIGRAPQTGSTPKDATVNR